MKYDKIVAMNQEKSRKKVDVAKREMKKIKEYVVLCQDLVQVKMRNFSPF